MISLTFREGLLARMPCLALSRLSVAVSASLFALDVAEDVVETSATLAVDVAVDVAVVELLGGRPC